ncbi:hypothetical protein ACMCNP_03615 [Candidatus Acidulodesulfobacterium sp. H_13]|uniref:hypothetical protein n=1 Tax=Candidatus Acidulodesulfobacterium sp. H_13 TaxID=3395470 RepID=UPI003AF438A8
MNVKNYFKRKNVKNVVDSNGAAVSNVSSGTAALFSILGGVCCWGPLTFSILGITASTGGFLGSTVSFLKGIVPYRNYFLILDIIGVLLSFYFLYISPKISSKKGVYSLGKGDIDMSNGETCDCKAASPFSVSKIVFYLSVAITVGFFIFLYKDTGTVFMAWPKI